VGYPESYNELDRWRDTLRLSSPGNAVIRTIEDRIGRESDRERLRILRWFLYDEYVAQGRQDAADAIRGLDPAWQIHRWYNDWRRDARDIDIIPALEERIRSEADAEKLHELRSLLALEHKERGNYAASEAVYLADFEANPDEPMPLISLAEQKLHLQDQPEAAMPIIDRAVEAAMNAGIFRRHALATKARVALGLKAHDVVEDMLRRIMSITFTPGNIDIGAERDILDRLPAGSIDPEVARAYDEYCRARGKTRTTAQTRIDELVVRFARPTWRKVARIIAHVLDACERDGVETDGSAVEDRIRLMVEQGKLEAQGDLSQWRHSEIRRPDEGAPRASAGASADIEPAAAVIATRHLTMDVDGQEVEVPVTIWAPVDKQDHWRCEFEIGWPGGTGRGKAYGLDAVQALLIGLQNIGAQLYASEAHQTGKLKWVGPRKGYGFPLASALRDRREGEDEFL
jgi:Protein of unknown function